MQKFAILSGRSYQTGQNGIIVEYLHHSKLYKTGKSMCAYWLKTNYSTGDNHSHYNSSQRKKWVPPSKAFNGKENFLSIYTYFL